MPRGNRLRCAMCLWKGVIERSRGVGVLGGGRKGRITSTHPHTDIRPPTIHTYSRTRMHARTRARKHAHLHTCERGRGSCWRACPPGVGWEAWTAPPAPPCVHQAVLLASRSQVSHTDGMPLSSPAGDEPQVGSSGMGSPRDLEGLHKFTQQTEEGYTA